MDAHRLAELRSLALHREIARRLRTDPELLVDARARVQSWLASAEGPVHPEYAQAWRQWLDLPVDVLIEHLLADDDEGRAMRQVTPFAGVIDPRTRWQIWRAVRRDVASGAAPRRSAH